jgi:hypothetical protein
MTADGDKNVQSSAASARSRLSALRPASASGFATAGKSGMSTSWTPGLASRLPAPPTMIKRFTPEALTAVSSACGSKLRKRTELITAS